MELSSKIKAMKFMRRKDDKEARKVQETDLQEQLGTKSHWKVAAVTGASNSKKFNVEYEVGISSGGRRVYGEAASKSNVKSESKMEEERLISVVGEKRRLNE